MLSESENMYSQIIIVNEGYCLALLDLSAAFDTIDHDKLLTYLSDYLGFGDNALKSYLSDRTQCFQINEILSETTKLICGGSSARKCAGTPAPVILHVHAADRFYYAITQHTISHICMYVTRWKTINK